MTESLTVLSLELIRVHPDNPRLDAVADVELVESVRLHGLIDPPLVAPDPENTDGVVLLDGHRRYSAAQQAGLVEIPVRLRDDLVTTAQQIEVMAITGLQKELLSPVEEARAYEQLVLLGMDEKAIAKSTGYTRARVKSRLKLANLTPDAQTAVHTGQATLTDVEVFHEFADDPDALTELEEKLGTNEFQHTVQILRSRRARLQRYADIVAGFVAAGAVEAKPDDQTQTLTHFTWRDSDLATPEGHTESGCLGYIDYGAASYAEPRLVCINPSGHADVETDTDAAEAEAQAQQRSEWEAREAEREAERERQHAADAARKAWLLEHFTTLFPTKSNAPLAGTLAGFLPALLADGRTQDLLDNVACLEALDVTAPEDWQYRSTAVHTGALDLTTAKPARLLTVFARFLAGWCAELLAQTYVEDEELPTVVWLWDWLAESGYPMSEVDRERHAELAARASEQDDDEAVAS